MKWCFKRRGLAAALAAALALAFGAGCAAMADPEGSELPWTDSHGWEHTPNLPSSMLNN